MIRDRAHLRRPARRLEGAGVDRLRRRRRRHGAGRYPDGLSLLRAMAEIGHPVDEIGVPCYPEGHASSRTSRSLGAPRQGAFASYMTTQLCFDPAAIARGSPPAAPKARAAGPIGVPGVAEPHRLLAITARIGVADTHQFLDEDHAVRRAAHPIGRVLSPRWAFSRALRRLSPTRLPASPTPRLHFNGSRPPRPGDGATSSRWRSPSRSESRSRRPCRPSPRSRRSSRRRPSRSCLSRGRSRSRRSSRCRPRHRP